MLYKKIVILFFTLSFSPYLTSAQLIMGDQDAPEGVTFSFNIQQNLLGILGTFYVGAQENSTTGQEYAFSRLSNGALAFEPLAPETVTLNNQPDQNDPIFGQKINAIGLLKPIGRGDTPIVVTAAQPAVLYMYEDNTNAQRISLISTTPLHDAAANISSGIVTLTTDIIGRVFAAVSPANGTFGQLNSGIAVAVRGNMDDMYVFQEINTTTGTIVNPQAARLDPTTAAVRLGADDLAAMGDNVSMHWDSSLKRLFIGLQTTANSGTTDGTRAVVIGTVGENGTLTLSPIAPDTAFAPGSTDDIVGVLGANQTVTIHDLTTLTTSTALHYLIVVGGNGNFDATQQSVFALPLVNSGDAIGTLASVSTLPVDIFQESDVPKLIARTVSDTAQLPADMTQATDSAALVGGGQLTAGPINTLTVRDDTIFVFVGNGAIANSAGVYCSQALFDDNGKIKAWTTWQRAAGTTNNIFGGALDAFSGTFILASGNNATSVNTVKRTLWANGDPQGLLPVTTLINNTLPLSNGGVQSLTTFIPTPDLTQIPFLAFGGIGTLVLVQTGQLEDGVLIPTPANDFSSTVEFTNGSLNENVDAKIVTISGGALSTIGSIITTAIGTDELHSWLFVGGTNGVAILSQSDGSSWDAQTQLGNNFDGLSAGMSFKILGSYSFVKKIIADENFLFIITNDLVDRIDLTSSNFATNTIDAVTIATKVRLTGVANMGGILDGIISQSFGVLATTAGLQRVGNGNDIRAAFNETDLNWTPVIIPEGAGAPTVLLGVSQTDQQDIAQNNGGHMYVLTASTGDNQSRINRFVINPVDNGPVQSTTLQPFNDLFVENIPSFFINFGLYKSNIATDGALYFATRGKDNYLAPQTVLTPAYPQPQVATRGVGEHSTTLIIPFSDGTEINALERSQASGSWIIAGDFGMHVLE